MSRRTTMAQRIVTTREATRVPSWIDICLIFPLCVRIGMMGSSSSAMGTRISLRANKKQIKTRTSTRSTIGQLLVGGKHSSNMHAATTFSTAHALRSLIRGGTAIPSTRCGWRAHTHIDVANATTVAAYSILSVPVGLPGTSAKERTMHNWGPKAAPSAAAASMPRCSRSGTSPNVERAAMIACTNAKANATKIKQFSAKDAAPGWKGIAEQITSTLRKSPNPLNM
mmetsp:Transcript_37006/g.73239  ORF Transcript_37006/g.73239 Transcript_37006/m.73239 type:complete len:226 (+) Transcript_37006:1252-1929(+)